MEVVQETYLTYLWHGPLDRPAIRPLQPYQWMKDDSDLVNFNSIELRMRSILLDLVPECVKRSCLSTRQLSTADILFATHVDAGPGTGTDKSLTLRTVSTARAVEPHQVCEELQRWKFAATRLARLGVAPPDPILQLDALKTIIAKMLDENQEVKHLLLRLFRGPEHD